MRDAKLTISRRRLKWLKEQDAFVAWLWLRLNDWRVPRGPERLFAFSALLRRIEHKFYPALEYHK